MTRTLVLLSTWNGRHFLPAQLASIWAQDVDGSIEVLVRDDGSTDGTVEYLESLAEPRLRLIKGDNLGPRGSYFTLLRQAQAEDPDYVALCDQDDVWRPDKLSRAIAKLGDEGPALYASTLDLVDEELQPISTYRHPGDQSFVSTMLGNFVTGCTCVINRAMLRDIVFPERQDAVRMHDWWLASLATVGARVIYDPVSSILYRQHATNHVGIRTGIGKFVAKVRAVLFETPPVSRFDHAGQVKIAIGDRLSPPRRALLDAFLRGRHSPLQRLRFVLRYRPPIDGTRAMLFVLFG